jgi:hypothetical protein
MRRALLGTATILLLGLGAWLTLAPVPVEPVAWRVPANPGYTGPFTENTRLGSLPTIGLDGAVGPEHIAMGPDGHLYAAVAGGTVLRMRPDGGGQEVWAQTGGRVLGFEFDADGRMIAADALRGLLAISPAPPHHVTVLLDRMPDGEPIRFPDAVTVARDGTIYFTDATRRFAPAAACPLPTASSCPPTAARCTLPKPAATGSGASIPPRAASTSAAARVPVPKCCSTACPAFRTT